MLIVAVTMLISVMGMHGSQTAEHLRDRFVQASLGVLVLFTLSSHEPILLGLIFLAWLRPG